MLRERSCSVRENGIHKGVGCRNRSLILTIIRNSVMDVLKQSRDECRNRLGGTKAGKGVDVSLPTKTSQWIPKE